MSYRKIKIAMSSPFIGRVYINELDRNTFDSANEAIEEVYKNRILFTDLLKDASKESDEDEDTYLSVIDVNDTDFELDLMSMNDKLDIKFYISYVNLIKDYIVNNFNEQKLKNFTVSYSNISKNVKFNYFNSDEYHIHLDSFDEKELEACLKVYDNFNSILKWFNMYCSHDDKLEITISVNKKDFVFGKIVIDKFGKILIDR